MKRPIIAISISSLLVLAASAYKLPDDDNKLAGLVTAQVIENAEEAIFVGHILCEAATGIAQKYVGDDEIEEYSWRGFWQKVKQALITAAQKLKAFFTKLGKELLESVKEVAKSAAEAAVQAAKEKALEKAAEIVDKLMERSMASYSLLGSENRVEFVTYFCERMDKLGKQLIENGEKALGQ